MTVDNTKASFSSLWDIDQLIANDSVAVGSGDTAVYTIADAANPSSYELQFKPTGSSKWYGEGSSSSDNTVAGLFVFYSYVNGTSIHAVAPTAGTVRWYVWEDKINNT